MTIFLNVPYSEKDLAKRLGARWDAAKNKWYVPEGMFLSPFECWLPSLFDSVDRSKGKKRGKKRRDKNVDRKSFGVTVGELYPTESGGKPPWE